MSKNQWSSSWGFILAATGAAVGLGNIWRFPYMAGTHGGGAFVALYLLFVLLIGIPIMLAEFVIGRHSQKKSAQQNPVEALVSQGGLPWGALGWWGALALLLTLSFYSVVSGWSIAYLYKTATGIFQLGSAAGVATVDITAQWENLLASPWQMLGWHSVFMTLTLCVVAAGVQQGLERATQWMMPGLYAILFLLVSYAAVSGDFAAGVDFLFRFDYEKITPDVVIAALGHAFFTLALGAGALVAYGAYIPPQVRLIPSVLMVVILDVLVAVLSGLAIFPLVFAHHLTPDAGPGLMFLTLPHIFREIPYGSWIGGCFFTLLLFAAWTSSINLAEPLVMILRDKCRLSRIQASLAIGGFAWLLGIGSVLSFNQWKHVYFFKKFTVFDLATNIPTDILLPVGGIGFAIFAGWVMTREQTAQAMHTKRALYTCWRFLVRYVAPVGVLCALIGALY